MASVITNYWGNLILTQYLVTNGAWLSLHTGDPGVTGDMTTELDSVSRQLVTFNAASSKGCVSSNKQIFGDCPASTIVYLGLCDSQVSGHLLCAVLLGTPIVITASGVFITAPGDIAVGL